MVEIGLWIKTEAGETFLIKKDPLGHPVFSATDLSTPLETIADQKVKLRDLYEGLTGHPHPHAHATSRQLMWDFLEAALKQLP
jgi:hypothetical protein